MKLTTTTQHFDREAMRCVQEIYQRADASLFSRRTYELFAGYWGVREDLEEPIVGTLNTRPKHVPDTGADIAHDLVGSRAFPKGVTIQVYRPAGRPQYAS
jgi:hypothetical protein